MTNIDDAVDDIEFIQSLTGQTGLNLAADSGRTLTAAAIADDPTNEGFARHDYAHINEAGLPHGMRIHHAQYLYSKPPFSQTQL